MNGFTPLTGNEFETLAGVIIVACGLGLLLRPRAVSSAVVLTVAGVTWLAPVVQVAGMSTQFIHRALLAAALASASVSGWWRRPAYISLAVFAVVCLVPDWATSPWLNLITWSVVLVITTVLVWRTPRRVRMLPAIGANAAMMLVATLGVELSLLNSDLRLLVYNVAAATTAVLVVRAVRSPIVPELALEVGATWSVGVREPGADNFVTIDGRRLDTSTDALVAEFDVGELGRAALVHDDPAFDDPKVRDRLQVAVRLLAEQVVLLRRIDDQTAAVELSRQRVLDADHEASLAMIEAVERTVQPHLDAIACLLEESAVPNDRGSAGLLREVSDEIRSLCMGSLPAQLEHGLGHALRLLGARSPIPAHVLADEPILAPAAAHALFMVASEAATNAAKHSEAQHLTIELIDEQRCTSLRVTDDGRGGAVERSDGGLAQSRRRLAELDGSLDVYSCHDGTVVTARLPRVGS